MFFRSPRKHSDVLDHEDTIVNSYDSVKYNSIRVFVIAFPSFTCVHHPALSISLSFPFTLIFSPPSVLLPEATLSLSFSPLWFLRFSLFLLHNSFRKKSPSPITSVFPSSAFNLETNLLTHVVGSDQTNKKTIGFYCDAIRKDRQFVRVLVGISVPGLSTAPVTRCLQLY